MGFIKKRKKIIKIFGFFLIGIGILILLFPLYTNFIVSRRESRILSSWEVSEEILEIRIDYEEKPRKEAEEEVSEDNEIFYDSIKDRIIRYDNLTSEDFFPLKIIIPKIELEWTVNEGVDRDTLRKGPGYISQTPLPGESGRSTISGHRTTYGAPFNRIDELDKGDFIYLESIKGYTFTYVVKEQIIVDPDEVSVLSGTSRRELLLTACTPKFSAAKRLVVVAELVEIFPFYF